MGRDLTPSKYYYNLLLNADRSMIAKVQNHKFNLTIAELDYFSYHVSVLVKYVNSRSPTIQLSESSDVSFSVLAVLRSIVEFESYREELLRSANTRSYTLSRNAE